MTSTIHILSVPIGNVTKEEACAFAFKCIEEGRAASIATANAEMVMRAQSDEELADILRHADLVVPDGAGVLWAAEQIGKQFKERVAGIDLACRLVGEAALRQTPVYFFGGAEGVARDAAANLEKQVGKLHIVGTHSGFFTDEEEKQIIDEIPCQHGQQRRNCDEYIAIFNYKRFIQDITSNHFAPLSRFTAATN